MPMLARFRRSLSPLAVQLADEQAAHEATRRSLSVAQAEIAALAAVVARDRARIEAETAAYARARAEHEGAANVGRVG